MKETILKELCSPHSKCRVVFATMALGMGVNIPSVREVIHIGPPRSVREYFQEAGRAGRDNKQSHAILYYNNHDIAANKPGMMEHEVILQEHWEVFAETVVVLFRCSISCAK